MKKGLVLKLGITGLLVAIFCLAWLYDFLRTKEYDVQVVYISNKTPTADFSDTVDFDVWVTRNGKPCAGHEIEARCSAGSFRAYLGKTNKYGVVRFTYIPYVETAYQKAGPVEITLLELSNSAIIEVNVVETFSDIVVQPKA